MRKLKLWLMNRLPITMLGKFEVVVENGKVTGII